ncbi:hypothetical protein GCM10009547_41780 [Sporichthya brevicatena]|uniref:FHA domain-containing protein n=1 Tax=Sporichthya brevicatena TaxID=171442 RepID=A0ABP3SCU5_9ACTN
MLGDRRLVVVERIDDVLHTLATRGMHPGESVTVGRAAELPIGHTHDARISRLALTVTCTEDGWAFESTNRNGVLIHPWGQPPRYAQREETTAAPRVALRIVGSIVREHWVLLEDDTRLASARPGRANSPGGLPGDPTHAELEALRLLFPDLLEWPPLLTEWPPGIEQVARELRVTTETLMRHLDEVRNRAVALGLPPEVTIADPEYVHLLVQAGWLRPELFPESGAPSPGH